MGFYGLVWILYGFYMEKKNQTINPFLMNLGLKNPTWYIGCVLDLGWLIVILN